MTARTVPSPSPTSARRPGSHLRRRQAKRLKKVEGLSPATLCTALPPAANVTTYFGPVEVRNWLGAEQVLTYPQPSIKLTNGTATWLHFDHLGSVRAITDATGAKVESAIYRPFGEQSEWLQPGNASPETKGWTRDRYDADAGLQYLNARYYDPALGLFLQPDWFEVTKPGVGTNRFSYSFNDPVNKIDPGGNESCDAMGACQAEETDPPSCEETGSCDYRLENWFSRQRDNLKAAWSDPVAAAGGFVRGLVQDGVALWDNTIGYTVATPNGEISRAVYGGIAGGEEYVTGEMSPAEQGGYLIGSVVTGVAGIAKAAAKGATKTIATNLPTSGRKFNQLSARGWDKAMIDEVVNSPVHTSVSVNKATGNPATAFFDSSGDYIVRDNVTGDIV